MNGAAKSTCFSRSGVMVRPAAAMSPRPSASAGKRRSRLTATNTRFTLMFFVLSRLLRNVSNSLPAS